MKPRMDANGRELALKKEVYAVVGCTIELLKVPTKEPPVNAKQRESKAEAADVLAELDANQIRPAPCRTATWYQRETLTVAERAIVAHTWDSH